MKNLKIKKKKYENNQAEDKGEKYTTIEKLD